MQVVRDAYANIVIKAWRVNLHRAVVMVFAALHRAVVITVFATLHRTVVITVYVWATMAIVVTAIVLVARFILNRAVAALVVNRTDIGITWVSAAYNRSHLMPERICRGGGRQ
jgi:hypothetical protein